MNISAPIARLFQAYRHSTLFCGTLLWKRFVKNNIPHVPLTRHLPANPELSLTFCKTPSGRSATEPSTGHFVMNISPPVTPIGAAGEEGGSKCPIRIFFLSKMVVILIFSVIFTSDNYVWLWTGRKGTWRLKGICENAVLRKCKNVAMWQCGNVAMWPSLEKVDTFGWLN